MRETIKGTIMIISHQERILSIADEIVVLANGMVTRTGTSEILPELLMEGAAATVCDKFE